MTFLTQHWPAGVIFNQTDPLTPCTAAIIFCKGDDFTSEHQQTIYQLVQRHVPILIIETTRHRNQRWLQLSARNERIKYITAQHQAWYDHCLHFLSSLKQCLTTKDFSLLSTSLSERHQKQSTASV